MQQEAPSSPPAEAAPAEAAPADAAPAPAEAAPVDATSADATSADATSADATSADAAPADAASADARAAGTAWWPGVPVALLLYAVLRATGVLTLWAYANAEHRGLSLWELLSRWDAGWYAQIATDGYDHAMRIGPDGQPLPTNLAFFPLYPGLVAALHTVMPVVAAEMVVSWGAGLATAGALYAIGARLRDPTTGVLLACLWAVIPHAIVESMGYSETTFTALAAWSLFAVLRRRWLTAAVLCLLAGLTRPTGAALAVVIVLAAVVAVCRSPRTWQAWIAIPLAPLGVAGFVGWVGLRLGRWDGYTYIQDVAWRLRFDGGVTTVASLGTVITRPVQLAFVVTNLALMAGLALLIIGIGERLPWPLLGYGAGVLALAIGGAGYDWSKTRLLIPAFPLLLPIAYGLARSRNRTVPIAVITLLAVLSAFDGVYVRLIWQSSP